MSTLDEEDRREYYRIEDVIALEITPLSAAEVDSGKRAGLPSDVAEKMKALERENRELRQANEILRKASADRKSVV